MGNTDSRTHPTPDTWRSLDAQAAAAKQSENIPRVRVLVVGTPMSGKTTLIQQLRVHYGDTFHRIEMEKTRKHMGIRLLRSICTVIRNVYVHGRTLEEDSRHRGVDTQDVFAEARNSFAPQDTTGPTIATAEHKASHISHPSSKMLLRCSVLPSPIRILMLQTRNSAYNPSSHLFSDQTISSYRSFVTAFILQLHAFTVLESMEDINLFKLISPRLFRLPAIPSVWTAAPSINNYQNVQMYTLLHEPVTPDQAKFILSHLTLKNLNVVLSQGNVCTWLSNVFGIPIMRPIHPQQCSMIRPAEHVMANPVFSCYFGSPESTPLKLKAAVSEHGLSQTIPPHVLMKPRHQPTRVYIPKGSIVSMGDVINRMDRHRNVPLEINGFNYWHSMEIANAKSNIGINHRDRLFHTKMDDMTAPEMDSTTSSSPGLGVDRSRRPQSWANGSFAREWDIGKVRPFESACLLEGNDEQISRLVYRYEGYRARHVASGGVRSVLLQTRHKLRHRASQHTFKGASQVTKDHASTSAEGDPSSLVKVVKRIQPHSSTGTEGSEEWLANLMKSPTERVSSVSAEVRSLYSHTFVSAVSRNSLMNHALAGAAMIDDSLASSPIKNCLLPSRVPEQFKYYRNLRAKLNEKEALHPYAVFSLNMLKTPIPNTGQHIQPLVKHLSRQSCVYREHVQRSLISLDRPSSTLSEESKQHVNMVTFHNVVLNPKTPVPVNRQSMATLHQRQDVLAGCYVLGSDDGYYKLDHSMQLHYQLCILQRLEQAQSDSTTPSFANDQPVSNYFMYYTPPSIGNGYDDFSLQSFISKTQQRQLHAFLKNTLSISSTSGNVFSLANSCRFSMYSCVAGPGCGIGFAPELTIAQRAIRHMSDLNHTNMFFDAVSNMAPHVSPATFFSLQRILETVETAEFDNTLANHISKVWADRGLASTLTHYATLTKDYNGTYFQRNIPKILGVEPQTRVDMAMTTVTTQGIQHQSLQVQTKATETTPPRTKFILDLIDTGGKLHDRRAWIKPLHSVDVVLYVLNIAHFDSQSTDVEGLNALVDGLRTLHAFSKTVPARARLVVYLNGLDMFAYKLQACFGNFTRYIPEYKGPNATEKITIWLMRLCEKMVKPHEVKFLVGSAIEEKPVVLAELDQLFESCIQ